MTIKIQNYDTKNTHNINVTVLIKWMKLTEWTSHYYTVQNAQDKVEQLILDKYRRQCESNNKY